MAAERGGRADKLGNRYEGFWIARNLLLVLAGDARSVKVEAIGDNEKGVDLWVTNPDQTRDAHQCKRKNRSKGQWSMADLRERGVLEHLAGQIRRNVAHRFIFVSGDKAPLLRSLGELARTSDDDPEALHFAT